MPPQSPAGGAPATTTLGGTAFSFVVLALAAALLWVVISWLFDGVNGASSNDGTDLDCTLLRQIATADESMYSERQRQEAAASLRAHC